MPSPSTATRPDSLAEDVSAEAATIIVCETCGTSDRVDGEPTRGEALGELMRAAADGAALDVTTTRCLMACGRRCTALVRAPGKYAYVLGDLEVTAEQAAAVVDYARKLAASDRGVVPYKTWPDGVRGKFVCRVPPTEELSP